MAIFQRHLGVEHRFEHRGALQPPAGFDELIRVSVSPSGPVALWADANAQGDIEARFENPGSASFPKTRTSSGPHVALAAYDTGSMTPAHTVVMSDLPVAHPLIQVMPDGKFLVVGARCCWRPEGAERNALLIGLDGGVEREGTLGDGIEHLLVDDSGEIWVGYFDEGVGGNFGWGGPGPEPLGSPGIVRWSSHFEKVWEHPTATSDYCLVDCYALNVGPDRTWACPDMDFPILEIDSERVTVHQTTDILGPRGLVVSGEHVALIGDYQNLGSLRMGSLDSLSGLEQTEIHMPDGSRVPPGTLVCRGSVAHLFVGADWFTFDLAHVAAS